MAKLKMQVPKANVDDVLQIVKIVKPIQKLAKGALLEVHLSIMKVKIQAFVQSAQIIARCAIQIQRLTNFVANIVLMVMVLFSKMMRKSPILACHVKTRIV